MFSNFFKQKPQSQTGLEINFEGITVTCLKKEKNKFSLKYCGYEPFEEKAISNDMIINADVFIRTLTKIFENYQFNDKTVNIAIPSSTAFIKIITLPNLPANELEIIMHQEAPKHIPFPISEANIDFAILENTRQEKYEGKKVDIILIALAKDVVKNYVDIINNIGLNIEAIDVTPFAMIRALAHADLIDDSDDLFISVLIDYENTDINIVHKGMPLFSHNTSIGKKNIIDALSTNLEIGHLKAEKMLSEIMLAVPGLKPEADQQLNEAAAIVRTIYNNICAEIQKTIEFYSSQTATSKKIKRIIIGGCGVCVQNIDKYTSNRLKIDAVLCDPLKNISHNIDYAEDMIHQVNIPALTTSVGLALKGLEN